MRKTYQIIFMCLLIAAFMASVTASPSLAATTWVNCTVTSVGPSNTDGFVQLTAVNGSFKARWFHLSSTATNALLATAIAAFTTSGKKVQVGMTGTAAYSDVTAMYIY